MLRSSNGMWQMRYVYFMVTSEKEKARRGVHHKQFVLLRNRYSYGLSLPSAPFRCSSTKPTDRRSRLQAWVSSVPIFCMTVRGVVLPFACFCDRCFDGETRHGLVTTANCPTSLKSRAGLLRWHGISFEWMIDFVMIYSMQLSKLVHILPAPTLLPASPIVCVCVTPFMSERCSNIQDWNVCLCRESKKGGFSKDLFYCMLDTLP